MGETLGSTPLPHPIRGSSAGDGSVVARGTQRFKHFAREAERFCGRPLSGKLLDFGCGAGGFLSAAVDAGLDAFGVEVEEARETQFRAHANTNIGHRFIRYDGQLLPFRSHIFDTIYSWFVFEHVTTPNLSLREIVRVARIGGTIHLYADDARNHWDGHVGIPFPAFLPRQFTRAYLEVFGKEDRADFINDTVVYITAPMITSVLTTLGCQILYENAIKENRAVPGGSNVSSESEARVIAIQVKERLVSGLIAPPKENLHVVARRLA